MRIRILTLLALMFSGLTFTNAAASDIRPVNVINVLSSRITSPSSLATAPNGDIWVADWVSDQVYLFSKDASGAAVPLKTISLFAFGQTNRSLTDASSIAVDSRGFLYVLDASVFKVYVFNPTLGNSQDIGDATRTIALGHRARSIALDSEGRIYVAGRYQGKLEVRVFASGTSNSPADPLIGTFQDTTTTSSVEPYGMSILPFGEVAVTWYDQADIRIYSTNLSTFGSRTRTITGLATNLGIDTSEIKSDPQGRLYIYKNNADSVQIYSETATGNVAPISTIGLDANVGANYPQIVGHGYGWGLTLGFDSQIWIGDGTGKLVHFNNPFPQVNPSPVVEEVTSDNGISQEAKRLEAVEAKRLEAVEAQRRQEEAARAEISTALISGRPLTTQELMNASIVGITPKNIDLFNSEMAKLATQSNVDLNVVEKVAFKFATVDKIAEQKSYYPADLVRAGLIPAESKIKTTITQALRRQPLGDLDTYEKIHELVLNIEKKWSDRQARLLKIINKSKG